GARHHDAPQRSIELDELEVGPECPYRFSRRRFRVVSNHQTVIIAHQSQSLLAAGETILEFRPPPELVLLRPIPIEKWDPRLGLKSYKVRTIGPVRRGGHHSTNR